MMTIIPQMLMHYFLLFGRSGTAACYSLRTLPSSMPMQDLNSNGSDVTFEMTVEPGRQMQTTSWRGTMMNDAIMEAVNLIMMLLSKKMQGWNLGQQRMWGRLQEQRE
jgi:hypothetical protein